MNSSVRPLIIKMLMLLGIMVVIDIALGVVFNNLFYKQKSGKFFTTTHALKHASEDIAIFGNSHAAQHFNAALMQQQTSKKVFNYGNQGQGLFYMDALIRSMLAYHKPQLIIINLDVEELKYDKADYQRMAIFLPYYHFNKQIDTALALSGNMELFKAHSALYRYNSLPGYMLLNTYKPTYNKSMQTLGFDPSTGSLNAPSATTAKQPALKEKIVFDDKKIACLKKLVMFIKTKQVSLLATTTPLYNYKAHFNPYQIKLKAILNSQKVNYFDDAMDTDLSNKAKYFHDESHLNETGANMWTTKCVQYILAGQAMQ